MACITYEPVPDEHLFADERGQGKRRMHTQPEHDPGPEVLLPGSPGTTIMARVCMRCELVYVDIGRTPWRVNVTPNFPATEEGGG